MGAHHVLPRITKNYGRYAGCEVHICHDEVENSPVQSLGGEILHFDGKSFTRSELPETKADKHG